MSYTYEYPRPALTIDALIIARDKDGAKLLLIQRGQEPFMNKWALPGGFIEMDEDLESGIAREIEEETGLKLSEFSQLKTYGAPNRDPRHRTITVAFYKVVSECLPVKGMDDAICAQWFLINDLPPLAFDHQQIVDDAIVYLKL